MTRPSWGRLAQVAAAGLAMVGLGAAGVILWQGRDDGGPSREPRPASPAPDDSVVVGDHHWRPVPIGAGGFVTGMVATTDGSERVIFARTDVGGAHRWDDDARRWYQVIRASTVIDGIESSDYSVASLAVAPSSPERVLLVVGADHNPGDDEELPRGGRVLRSDDGGETWRASSDRWFVHGNDGFRTGRERVAIDPTDPDRAYLGTQREGLWTSDDGGATWDQVPLDVVPDGVAGERWMDQAGVSLVATVPGSGDGTVVVGVANAGLFTSTDRGGTWTELVALEEGEVPSSATLAGGAVILSIDRTDGAAGRLIRIDPDSDGGRVTDLSSPSEWPDRWVVAASPHDPDRLIATDGAVRDGHLWTSADGGSSWQTHDVEISSPEVPWLEATDLDSWMSAGALLFDPIDPDLVWFAEGMGVWTSDDLDRDTIVWESTTVGIEEIVVSSIVVPPGQPPIVVGADRQGFRLPALDHFPVSPLVDERFASGTSVDYSAGDPRVLAWVGAESNRDPSQAEPRGAVSSDGGETWSEMTGLERRMFGGEVAVSATDPDVIVWLPTQIVHPERFRDDPLGLYASSDRGRSWQHVRPDGEVDSFHRFFWWFSRRALAADRVDGRFYLMSDEERFYASDDGGETWERAAHAPPCSAAVDCHVFGQVQAIPGQAGHLWASTVRGGLHRTTDAGASPWERVAGIAEARAFGFGAPLPGSDHPVVFVHGRADEGGPLGIWRSSDDGATWSLVAEHPADLALGITAVAGDPDVPGRVFVGFDGAGAVYGQPVD